uniref:OmpA family protein n=1 Tax=candidate division WOR-3 bacterium TaxID=2052148 RepID=A0A7C6A988_UNCW3
MKYLSWLIALVFIGIFVLFYNFKYLPTLAELVKQTDENIMWQTQIQELKATQKPFVYKIVYSFDELFGSPTSLSLSPKGESTLKAIIPELEAQAGDIWVCGHTADTPIPPSLIKKYPTNWELSTARAVVVLRYLEKLGIKSERLVALGYGQTRPVISDSLEANRRLLKANARIEIMVVRK